MFLNSILEIVCMYESVNIYMFIAAQRKFSVSFSTNILDH